MDSKADRSKLIGNENKLREYLDIQLKSKEKELFIIVSKEVLETESWKLINKNFD